MVKNGQFDFFNLKSGEHIGVIPHGPQMKETYFYEKWSNIEEKLDRDFERKHASLIRKLLEGEMEIENKLLLQVVLLMHFRTKVMRDKNLALRQLTIDQHLDWMSSSFRAHLEEEFPGMFSGLSDEALKKIVQDGAYSEYLKKTDITKKLIENFKWHQRQVSDLKVVILDNPTGVNLISSDHPVIHINPFLINHNSKFGRGGLAQLGAILALPINPRKLVVCYDSGVYENPLDINQGKLSENDIHNLNKLQILCGTEGIYSLKLPSNISALISDTLRTKQDPVFVQVDLPNNYQLTYTDSKLPNLPLSFIKEKSDFKNDIFVLPYARPAQKGWMVSVRYLIRRLLRKGKTFLKKV